MSKGALEELSNKFRFLDADTIRDEKGSVRFQDMWAPEVAHFTEEGLKPAEWGGEFYSELYSGLAKETGFDKVYRTGKQGKYGRDIGDLQDEQESFFTKQLVYQGLEDPVTEEQKELYDMGVFSRALNEATGETEEDAWETARQKKRKYELDTSIGWKTVADTEAEYKAGKDYFGDSYNIYDDSTVRFRDYDRTMDNEAKSNFSTGWESGWLGIQESLQEGISVIGDIIGSDSLYYSGQAGADALARQQGDLPTFANDIKNVDSLASLGNYFTGMMGVALPYMLGIAGGTVVGALSAAVGAPAALAATIGLAPAVWTYAGETYGNMEGEMDQKNAGVAMAGGVAMAVLDRLGLKGIIKPSTMLREDGFKQAAKAFAKENGVSEEAALKAVRDASGKVTIEAMKSIGSYAEMQIAKGLLAKQVGLKTIQGAGIESVTEALQETIGYGFGALGSEAEFDPEEYQHILTNALAGGAILGGPISGVAATTSELGGFKRLKRDLTEVNDNSDYEGGTAEDILDEINATANSETRTVVGEDGESKVIQADIDYVEKANNERIKGGELDTSKWRGGLKTLGTTLKEFPSRFVKKFGSLHQDAILDATEQGSMGRKAFAYLTSVAGHAKDSFTQGLTLSDRKRILTSSLFAELDFIKTELDGALGVGLAGRNSNDSTKLFVKYLKARAEGKPIPAELKGMEADLKTLREKIGGQHEGSNGLTDVLLKIVNNLEDGTAGFKGTNTKKRQGWFQESARLKVNEVAKDKKGFVKSLVSSGWSKKDAEAFWDVVVHGPTGYDPAKLKELGFKSFKSKSLQQNKDVLNAVFGEDSKFLERDPFERLKINMQEQVNYAIDKKYLGENGEKISKALMLIKEEMGDAWDPRIATHFMDNVDASRGDYRRMENKTLEKWIGHITWFNSFAHLSLSAIASLPEAAIVLLSAPKDQSIIESIGKGVKDLAHHYKIIGGDGLSYITSKSGVSRDEYIQNFVDFYRYGYGSGKHGAIGQTGIDDAVYKTSKFKEILMKGFFLVNGLKIYTDATRIARLSIANDAIFGDLEIIGSSLDSDGNIDNRASVRRSGLFQDAFGRLRELNIDPDLAAKQYSDVIRTVGEGKTEKEIEALTPDSMYKMLIEADPKFLETMDVARVSWVDNAIAHPDSMNRPLWYSNPHYRLFTQYNGFMSVFTSHILPKIWKKVKSADPTAKYNAVAIAATMIALGFLSQMMKDELKYGGKPQWITEKGYLQRGATSSGLLGTPERFLEILSPIYKSGYKGPVDHAIDATEGFLGPTWKHGQNLGKIFLNHIEGKEELRDKYLVKEVPLMGTTKVFKDWFANR